jgi:hypothetical protein
MLMPAGQSSLRQPQILAACAVDVQHRRGTGEATAVAITPFVVLQLYLQQRSVEAHSFRERSDPGEAYLIVH